MSSERVFVGVLLVLLSIYFDIKRVKFLFCANKSAIV